MNAKDEAEELYIKYNNLLVDEIIDNKPTYFIMTHKMAIKSALIAVDEILNYDNQFIQTEEQFNYWNEVKQEINKL
jgi:hypothetical protein